MMGVSKWIFRIVGVVFIVIGIAAIVWASQTSLPGMRWGIGAGVGSFVIVGIVFLVVAGYYGRLDPAALAHGIAGTAQILSVTDTGVTLNNLNAVFKVKAMVTIPTRAPYEAEFRVVVNRAQWGQMVPGATVAVRVDPEDPTKVAVDTNAGAPAGSRIPGMPVPGMPAAGIPGGQPVTATYSAADVVARGVATTGTIQSAAPTGMTAGQFATGLPPHEANDPLVHIAFTYAGPGGAAMHTQAMIRVPDGKGGRMAPGTEIPVRYLPEQPEVATIDWEGT